jgi:hypothetical protein
MHTRSVEGTALPIPSAHLHPGPNLPPLACRLAPKETKTKNKEYIYQDARGLLACRLAQHSILLGAEVICMIN